MEYCVTIAGKPILDIYECDNGRCWYVTKKVHKHGQEFLSGYVRCLKASMLAEFHYLPEEVLNDAGQQIWKVPEDAWGRCPCVDVDDNTQKQRVVRFDSFDARLQATNACSNHCKEVDEKMDEKIKQQIRFVLEDDNEGMQAALEPDSYLDEDNRQMNRELIKRHEQILAKLDIGELLSQQDLQLIRDANEIHLNDADNLNGHHKEAVELNRWLESIMDLSKEEAMKILEEWLDKNPNTPARVYRALHTLWEEATPNDVVRGAAFDNAGRCLKCGSRVSFADVTDTLVFVGDETVKRYDGDITNRNCVRCTYPEQYPDYEDYDEGDEEGRGIVRCDGKEGDSGPSPSYSKTREEVDTHMEQSVRTTLALEQCQCRKCGRMFYINAMEWSGLNLDFGCPYGCDDNGRHVRDIKAEVRDVTERGG